MGFGKDGRGTIIKESVSITIGALANAASVKAGTQLAITEDFRILKTEYFIVQNAAFAAEGDEVIIGVADNELTVAEISEAIGVEGPVGPNDNLGNERAHRPVWLLTQVKEPTDQTAGYNPQLTGAPFTMNLRWTFHNPAGWTWFAFNPLGGAITTGAVFFVFAKHFGVWVT